MTVLGRACADQRRWQHQHPTSDLGIAVNISTQQLMAASFPDTVAAVLKKENPNRTCSPWKLPKASSSGTANGR